MKQAFKLRIYCLIPAVLACSAAVAGDWAAVAADWAERLKPTSEKAIKGRDSASFNLNCLDPIVELKMDEYEQVGEIHPELLPREDCLSGDFRGVVYHKRSEIDPVAYHSRDDKPYLELFFSDLGNIRYDAVPSPRASYTLKLILYDFKGKDIYPIYHENETFKPRYDPEKPIARTEGGAPYLNYSKGGHIPFILGNFAAMHETRAYTFSTGQRLYGYDAFSFGEGSDGGIRAPGKLKVDPKRDFLGYVDIMEIGPNGNIRGKYKIRMLHETCSDPLGISHCRLLSSYVEGRFLAHPFRIDKKIMQQMMDQEADTDDGTNILKPRLKLTPADANSALKPKIGSTQMKPKLGSTQMKPKLGTQGSTSGAVLILTDVPKARRHKGLMGYQCGDPVLSACRTADRTFVEYLACMEKHNFARNKIKESAKIEQARQALQGCDKLYRETYQVQARRCKQLFIDDKDCLE